jgi:hypothetical protein
MVKKLQELVGLDRQFLITTIFVLLDIMTGSGSYRKGGLSTIRPGRQSSLGGGKDQHGSSAIVDSEKDVRLFSATLPQ